MLLFLAAGGLTYGVLYLNLRVAQRGLVPDPVVLNFGPGTRRVDISAALRLLSLPVSLGFGLLAGFAATPAPGKRGPDSRAQGGDRRVSEPGSDAGDAGGRPDRALRRLHRARREPAAVAGEAGAAEAAGAATSHTAIRALVAEAGRRYQAALEANWQVDWGRYGEEFRRLGEVLERLRTPE